MTTIEVTREERDIILEALTLVAHKSTTYPTFAYDVLELRDRIEKAS